MDEKPSLVVLISGSGSNLQAIIDAIDNNELHAEIKSVISNKKDAKGLERANKAGISTHIIDHKAYPTREAFDQAMIEIIDPIKPNMVILAGFMRILSKPFITHFHQRLLNIHPSLLPKYKGLNTHQQAIDNKDAIHGASVHYVCSELDSGPIVVQAEVKVLASDTVESLATRVLTEEHKIFPLVIGLHTSNRISFDGEQVQLDGKNLLKPLLWKNGVLIDDISTH